MKIIELKPSTRDRKKYMVVLEDALHRKTIHFGAKGYRDYTQHHSDKAKENYIKRHGARENFDDVMTPGFWARWILWNKPTVEQSLADVKRRFNL